MLHEGFEHEEAALTMSITRMSALPLVEEEEL